MDAFTISQLSQFSGIKPHTIRIWEQRYQILRPQRSDGNTRTYNGADLKKLLNIVSLQESGYKISALGKLNDDDLTQLTTALHHSKDNGLNHFVPQLLAAGMGYDAASFSEILSHCLIQFGTVRTYSDVIYPLINRVGLLWSADILPPAQEHFMSFLIRQKLLAQIDSLPMPDKKHGKWLLFLPEDEYHEIGLLLAHYLLLKSGRPVVYLGASVPLETVQTAIEHTNPENLLLFLVHYDFPQQTSSYLTRLSELFGRQICVSGNKKLLGQLQYPENVEWIQTIEDFEKIIVTSR